MPLLQSCGLLYYWHKSQLRSLGTFSYWAVWFYTIRGSDLPLNFPKSDIVGVWIKLLVFFMFLLYWNAPVFHLIIFKKDFIKSLCCFRRVVTRVFSVQKLYTNIKSYESARKVHQAFGLIDQMKFGTAGEQPSQLGNEGSTWGFK